MHTQTKARGSPIKNIITVILMTTAFTFIISFLMNNVLHICFIIGSSMEPTFSNGDVVKCADADILSRDDVVVFKKNHRKYIKRIIGLPGEFVQISGGYVYIDGVKQENPEGEPMKSDPGYVYMDVSLKENEYFCMGDNRNESIDSRSLGPVSKDEISCKVLRKEGKMFVVD